MLSASSEFDKLIANNSNMLIKARLTLADGTVREITGDDVIFGTPCFSEGTSSSSSFDIGACIMGKFNLSLANFDGRFDEYDFTGSTIEPSLGKELSDGSVEWIRKGLYHVDQPSTYGQTIALSSLDNMTRLERPYSDVETSYPASIRTIVRDICNKCGVVLVSGDIPCGDYMVSRRPSDDSLTCLAVLGYAVKMACCFAKFRYDGRLQIDWYDYRTFDSMEPVDGGEFDPASPYATGDTADGGNFVTYASGDTKEGGGFGRLPYKTICMISSLSVCTDDVVITGVSVTEQDDISVDAGGTGNEGSTVMWGKEGYVLDLGENPLVLYGQGPAVAKQIGERVVGMTFRPFESSSIGDPTLEAGDPVMVFDSSGRGYRSYVTSLTYKVGSYMSASCSAETPSRRSAAGYSAITKAIVDARNLTRTERSERQLALEALARELQNANGLYMTVSKQDDGSNIYFLHDKPTLADSKIVWKMTATAIGISTDGGETWPFGLDVSGTAILDRIYAIGLDARYLTVGRISDAKGKNFWDLDTGDFRLSVGAQIDGKDIATSDGVIASVDVEYAQNGSRTTPPTSGWSTDAPAWAAGKYIWSRTKTVMQSGEVSITDPVCISGVDGANGVDGKDGERGPAGRDGVSTYFHRAYATSADGRQGFSTTYGSGKTYLGTYVDSTPSDSTDPAKYQWSLIKGADGEDGVPGKNGTDGKTYYLHIAYATSADGSSGFSVSYGTGKTYIGQCVDLNVKDPTDPSAYTWSKIKGETGTGVSAVTEQYYLSTSSTAPSGGSWSEAQPAWSKGKYIWTRSKIVWTDGSTTYTAPCLAKAINGSNQMAGSAIVSRVKLYSKNRSDSVPPVNMQNPELGWDTTLPDWQDGYYVWSMERITYGDGTVTHTSPVLEAAYNKAYQSAHDISNSLDGLDSTVQDLAKDGVVTAAEAAAVKKALQDVNKEREEMTLQFNALKSDKALNHQFLATVLGPRYTKAFGTTDEGGTYGSYCDKVEAVLNCKTSEALEAAMYEYDAAYGAYATAVKDYSSAATAARHAIEQRGAADYADGILSNYDEQQTQKKIFDRLTNGGQTQGLYMENGKLYLNATYLGVGIIADAKGRSSWNLKTGELSTNYMKANNITATGSFLGGSRTSGFGMELTTGGRLTGYRDGKQYGYIDCSASSHDIPTGAQYKGMQLQADGIIRIASPKIAAASSSNVSTTATYGVTSTRTFDYVNKIEDAGNGTIRWTYSTGCRVDFIGGLCTAFGM